MKKINYTISANYAGRFLFFLSISLIFFTKVKSQICDPLVSPSLFGQSQTFIFCKGNQIGFGVIYSDTAQDYTFSVYNNGTATAKKAGPLTGNGGQLSVSAFMLSAGDAGQYTVTTTNDCGDISSTSFQAFYGSIDNLSISAWGSNSVTFKWAACGPIPAVTYEYAVTTDPDPNSVSINYLTTTDTTAIETGLSSGATYYIYVRVSEVFWNGQFVDQSFDCSGGFLPWQTIRFIPCSGVATAGSITPKNAFACVGGTATLSATGGQTYQWYDDNNLPVSGATSSSYAASAPGQYKIYVTTSTGCQGMVSSATLTQTSLQPGVLSGGGCYNIGDSVKLAVSKTIVGQTYKIFYNGVAVSTLQGIGKAYESEDSLWYNFKLTSSTQFGHYTVMVNNSFCAAIAFGDQLVSTYGTWTGVSNTNWLNAANWSCGVLPDLNTDVIIPNGAPNMPVVNNNVSCKSLFIQPGATLTVALGIKLGIGQ